MDLSKERLEVARALHEVDLSIQRLVEALAHSAAKPQLADAQERAPLRRVCEAFATIHYDMEDAVDSSRVCLGVLGVSLEVFKIAESVNAAKLNFKKICAPLSRLQTRVASKRESATGAITALRAILRSIQRSDVNVLAAYRRIPLLSIPPARITYSRANTRSVYRKSVAEIQMMLMTAEGPRASADRVRLEELPPQVTHLAYARGRHRENVRANIVYARLDARGRGRVQIAAELPILYVEGRREAPVVRFSRPVGETPSEARVRQSKLEPKPFLESMPVYRYVND